MRRNGLACGFVFILLALAMLAPAFGQRKQQKPQKGDKSVVTPSQPDERVVDTRISEMLAAWQIGNVELLHQYYADDVTVVSGNWEAPVAGWANYEQAYRAQRQRVEGVTLDRSNTLIAVRGNLAWCDYQWQFTAVVDGKPSIARGHTTLVWEKRNGRWLIVHNHTSLVGEMKEITPAAAPKPPAPEPAAPGR
jgi:ketosteroid isomerase-like protein